MDYRYQRLIDEPDEYSEYSEFPKNQKIVTLFHYLSIMYNKGSEPTYNCVFRKLKHQIKNLDFELNTTTLDKLFNLPPIAFTKLKEYLTTGKITIPEIENIILEPPLFNFIRESPNQWYFNFDNKFHIAISKKKYCLVSNKHQSFSFKQNLVIL
jgi:hypothetical protein